MTSHPLLPSDILVFERGWLSSNNILLLSDQTPALIDSGYVAHATQTISLVEAALGAQPLSVLVNTHLHSDHCGGNATLQARYPGLRTLIPPGHAHSVTNWDPVALSFTPTGQRCDPFGFQGTLTPGHTLRLGSYDWQVHAAPGHDPHSLLLFQPDHRILISADALWEKGFGVVFPEIEGISAFQEVSDTLDLIESLQPKLVIPGHGAVFSNVTPAIEHARQRLRYFMDNPERHAQHAAKVLIKFILMDRQQLEINAFMAWIQQTDYMTGLHRLYFASQSLRDWTSSLVTDLERSGVLSTEGQHLLNC